MPIEIRNKYWELFITIPEDTLEGVGFADWNLTDAIFDGQNMIGCDLTHTILNGSSFVGTLLIHTKFKDAKATMADFRFAVAQGADFSNAILDGCDFRGCDLREACFTGAHYADAKFQGTKVDGAVDLLPFAKSQAREPFIEEPSESRESDTISAQEPDTPVAELTEEQKTALEELDVLRKRAQVVLKKGRFSPAEISLMLGFVIDDEINDLRNRAIETLKEGGFSHNQIGAVLELRRNVVTSVWRRYQQKLKNLDDTPSGPPDDVSDTP